MHENTVYARIFCPQRSPGQAPRASLGNPPAPTQTESVFKFIAPAVSDG
jgi:hypothetical protein